MIIKKPYAFFIKNFRKIHIALLVLAGIVMLKQTSIATFTKEFIQLKTYDRYNFPITKYIPMYLLLITLILLVGSIVITITLKRKHKPWKIYLLPVITYALIFLADFVIRAYFLNYTGHETATEVSLYRDILLFTNIAQYPTMILFLVRILGLDLRRFNFNLDEEFLELSEDDQEEIEININIDKESFKRHGKRFIRHINYFYQEHKRICTVLMVIVGILAIRQTYQLFFVQERKYSQNEEYNFNGYTFKVNNSYYTDKSDAGKEIVPGRGFIIVDLTIRNNAEPRVVNVNNFHMLNGVEDYSNTDATYEDEFTDYGKVYDKTEILRDKTRNVILIFKVDSKLERNRFVLGYQEKGSNPYLRKIKLKITDVSKIDEKVMEFGEEITIKSKNIDETISVDEVNTTQSFRYKFSDCMLVKDCPVETGYYEAPANKIILHFQFGTENFESKELIDFSSKYGKIIYIDSKGKRVSVDMKNPIQQTYLGKHVYVEVPKEILTSKEKYLEYLIRNKKYVYKLDLGNA